MFDLPTKKDVYTDAERYPARLQTLLSRHYRPLAAAAGALPWILDTNIPTACTTFDTIRFNPEFMRTLTVGQQLFVAAHELLHVLSKHNLTMGDRDPRIWNFACDYWINLQLHDQVQMDKQSGKTDTVMEIPDSVLLDEKYRGINESQIYDQLIDDGMEPSKTVTVFLDGDLTGKPDPDGEGGKGNGNGEGEGEGSDISAGKAAAASAESMREKIEKINDLLNRLGVSGKMAGDGVGLLQPLVDECRKPAVDVSRVLKQFVVESLPFDSTFARPNLRLVARGIRMPGVLKQNTGGLVFAVDTSGSISEATIQQWLAICHRAFNSSNYTDCRVLWFHSQVWKTDEYKTSGRRFKTPDQIQWGGTSFANVFEESEQYSPKCLVMLTDGYDQIPKKPKYPVLWVIDNQDVTPEYGHIVRIPSGWAK